MQSACCVRVNGYENAMWLLSRLSHSFVFKNVQPMKGEGESAIVSFEVDYRPWLTLPKLESLLKGIPHVRILAEVEQR